ncbi:ATP-binding protein [Methylotenera sp.]|uniref:AAA family ATPase n=1 Tax=Methylotenera sp. TaxID=2051956 RepID=UPI002735C716|nr:ATP-binding protein [Methylotenera sp.]MDP3211909.1 ATP-binding protein [Methylotenera sp.]
MGSLRINKINYEGNNYYFQSELFDKNLVVIEGDNGTGKSTFCNLIYFGLGGKVNEFSKEATKRHTEITEDSNNYVELFVTISGKNYCFKRFINDNDIIVTPCTIYKNEESGEIIFDVSQYAQQTEVLPIYRQSAPRIFSDWMLELTCPQ